MLNCRGNSMEFNVAVLPGDGIGPEQTEATLKKRALKV